MGSLDKRLAKLEEQVQGPEQQKERDKRIILDEALIAGYHRVIELEHRAPSPSAESGERLETYRAGIARCEERLARLRVGRAGTAH